MSALEKHFCPDPPRPPARPQATPLAPLSSHLERVKKSQGPVMTVLDEPIEQLALC